MNAQELVGKTVMLVGGDFKDPTLNFSKGVVRNIDRVLLELDENGAFVTDGTCILESSIRSIVLPHTFDGETITIDYPADRVSPVAKTVAYRYHHDNCTVCLGNFRGITDYNVMVRVEHCVPTAS